MKPNRNKKALVLAVSYCASKFSVRLNFISLTLRKWRLADKLRVHRSGRRMKPLVRIGRAVPGEDSHRFRRPYLQRPC